MTDDKDSFKYTVTSPIGIAVLSVLGLVIFIAVLARLGVFKKFRFFNSNNAMNDMF
jgi:hypothetical protein